MRTLNDIDTLSTKERNELELITKRIKNAGSVAIIILYGSFARGEQVRNYDGKMSDYDILIITSVRNDKSIRRLRFLLSSLFYDIERRVSCEVETFEKVSKQFKEDYYFYSDIRRDGIVLYKKGNTKLPEPEDLNPERQLEISEKYFKTWLGASAVNIKTAKDSRINKVETNNLDFNKKAAFELQQCVENCYKTIELVHDRYAPKEHHLDVLRERIVKIAPNINGFFPVTNEEQQKDYKHLDEAYLRARYDDTYMVTETQLDYWHGEAKLLMEFTEQVCMEHIQKLQQEVE